jgi:hypothetical protein|nr:MAG TPA: hypothetical protein [Caudoviricetes sp.]
MKAKNLISILQNNLDADVVVSTVSYYEKSHYEAGYKREKPQSVDSITVDLGCNQIRIDGSKELTI